MLWDLSIKIGLVSALLLPKPGDVGKALFILFNRPSFWADLWATMWTWIIGIVIGTTAGGVVGFVLGFNKYIWAAIEPWIEFLRSLPSVVLVPLASIFIGVGTGSKLACSTLVVFALMVSSSSTAVRSMRASHIRLAISWRATVLQSLWFFYVPAALSHMAIAVRAAIPLALIVTVAADMLIATDSGLGRILMDAMAVFDTKTLYAGVLIVGWLGYAAARVSAFIEKKSIHWSGS
jgi:NitT/TauT family transport system permease protein